MKIFLSKILIFGAVAVSFLSFAAEQASACTCVPPKLDVEIRTRQNIAVFRVKSVTKYNKGEKRLPGNAGKIKSATLVVERVFKGSLSVGEETIFSNSGPCSFDFAKRDVGKRYIFYLGERPKDQVWITFSCSRSGRLESSGDDVRYLEEHIVSDGKPGQ